MGELDLDEQQKAIEETARSTQGVLDKIVQSRLIATQPTNMANNNSQSRSGCEVNKVIMYKPSQQSSVAFNSGAKERMIKNVEKPVDPLEPPKFKYKKIPRPSSDPPVPILRSPPRIDVEERKVWNSLHPHCISNWKNAKGYVIPLYMRLAADGRGLEDVKVNDNFAALSETLYAAETKSREAINMRQKVQKEMNNENERKEKELRELAQKARSERAMVDAAAAAQPAVMQTEEEENRERLQRDKVREERQRERKSERALEAKKDARMAKKSKITRDRDRDITEKVALGTGNVNGGGGSSEVMYDERLFNQEKGMDSGFWKDDSYNVYEKALFTAQSTMSTLYKPNKDADSDTYGDEQLEKIARTDRFKPHKAFVGTSEGSGPRNRLVEFEKGVEKDDDPFGLDQIRHQLNKGKTHIR